MFFSFILIFICSTITLSIGDEEARKSFEEFQLTYAKNYATIEEQQKRYLIFKDNLCFIKKTNAEGWGFSLGINEFADMSHKEFREIYGNGINVTGNPAPSPPISSLKSNVIPNNIDWRLKGAVTLVKNQGQCGSCWSFATTGAIEGAWYIKHKQLTPLSEQNLIDCSVADGNDGCRGGLMVYAYQYVIRNQGIEIGATYPYTANGPNYCKFNRSNQGANIQSYKEVLSGYETGLQEAVASTPVSVGIDSSPRSFQFYTGGIYNDPTCSPTKLDHAVLVVGYGADSNVPYWIVKNSWGPSWGVGGYIYMSRNRQNQCGIATTASYPMVNF